MRQSPMQAIF